jgi:LacI family transcriptional regulator
MVDNEAGGRLALEHLFQLGYRKIANIRSSRMLIDSAPRWRGIQKFAQASGIGIDSALALQLPDSFDPSSSFENGFRLTEELLQRKKRFTALMAFDELTALGAIRKKTNSELVIRESTRARLRSNAGD